jgi:hypothetical protein
MKANRKHAPHSHITKFYDAIKHGLRVVNKLLSVDPLQGGNLCVLLQEGVAETMKDSKADKKEANTINHKQHPLQVAAAMVLMRVINLFGALPC